MRTGWGDSPLEVSRRPEAPNHARRRAALCRRVPRRDTGHPERPGEGAGQRHRLPVPAGQRLHVAHRRARPGRRCSILRPDGATPPSTSGRARRATPTSSSATRVYGELWIGRRHTLAEKAAELGIAHRAPGRPGARRWPSCAPGRTRVLRGVRPAVDAAMLPYDTAEPAPRDRELATTLSELRLVKDEWEIAQLQDAIDATVRGFEDVARILPADRSVAERLIEGVFGLRARHDGNDLGYSSIVGAGAHATTLHWIRNTGATTPGELLLMDMGVENRNLYTADVTRTVPVNGRFSPAQRDVYDIVYRSQQAGIDAIAPGRAVRGRRDRPATGCWPRAWTTSSCCPCSVEEALDKESMVYRRWTPARLRPHARPGRARLLGRPQGDVPRRVAGRGLRAHRRAGAVLPARRRAGAGGAARHRCPDRGRRAGDRDRRRATSPTACRARADDVETGWPPSARPAPACPAESLGRSAGWPGTRTVAPGIPPSDQRHTSARRRTSRTINNGREARPGR